MVYSVRSNTPLIAKKPLKLTRTLTKEEREMRQFMENHVISVSTDINGKTIVKINLPEYT